jgi:hypothetical protein
VLRQKRAKVCQQCSQTFIADQRAVIVTSTVGIVLLEGEDGKIRRRSIDVSVQGAKNALTQEAQRVCRWRRSTEDEILVKTLKTANNKDALALQSRGKELKEAEQCTHCQKGDGPFASCVVDDPDNDIIISSTGACANCLFSGHRKRCSFRKTFFSTSLSACSLVLRR